LNGQAVRRLFLSQSFWPPASQPDYNNTPLRQWNIVFCAARQPDFSRQIARRRLRRHHNADADTTVSLRSCHRLLILLAASLRRLAAAAAAAAPPRCAAAESLRH